MPFRPLDTGGGLEKIVYIGAVVAIDTSDNVLLLPLHGLSHPIRITQKRSSQSDTK